MEDGVESDMSQNDTLKQGWEKRKRNLKKTQLFPFS